MLTMEFVVLHFWFVPRILSVLPSCILPCTKELNVVSFSEHNYVNVNVATPEGISRAMNLGLVPSHLSDTIVSAHVDLVTALFNANDRARAFVIFRHPVDRAASMFYFLKASGYAPLKDMTLDDYAKSELIENNWLGS